MLNDIQQGGIYKLPFPYTDFSEKKYRPALAITVPDSAGDARFVFITTTPPVPPAQRLILGDDAGRVQRVGAKKTGHWEIIE